MRKNVVLLFMIVIVVASLRSPLNTLAQGPQGKVSPTSLSFDGDVLPPLRAINHYGQPVSSLPQGNLTSTNTKIIINYNPPICTQVNSNVIGWPQAAKVAMEYAADRWSLLLVIEQPVRVSACWVENGPPGIAGAITSHSNFVGTPYPDTRHPAALANQLAGVDLNDNDGFDVDFDGNDADMEIVASFSNEVGFNGNEWYFGLDGNPNISEYDFVSVAMHELGHGLGFFGTMKVFNNMGSWGLANTPNIFDQFAEDGAGVNLLDTTHYPNPSTALAIALTDEDSGVFFNGPRAKTAIANNKVQLFTPDKWMSGSSYSHFGEFFNHTNNSLMTFSITNGEIKRKPGSVMLGLFADMGWMLVQDTQSFTHTVYLPLIKLTWGDAPTTCTPDLAGDAFNLTTAKTICSGQTVLGQVGESNGWDYYKIYVEDYQQLTISAHGSGVAGPGDVMLRLLDPKSTSGNILYVASSTSDENDEEFLKGIVLKSGFWYIQVSHNFIASGGTNYILTTTIADP